jgi:AraC-like DNA-binding protein
VAQKTNTNFRLTVGNNIDSNLNLEQIAFLCNMSLSTFKRHFKAEFDENPGKWIQRKRLNKAKELLSKGKLKASDIFLDFGYNSLSNFCAAYKKEFGRGPKEMTFFHK